MISMCSFHSSHIFMVYNNVECTKSCTILVCTVHFVYSLQNSYVYIHWILDCKYILVLLIYFKYYGHILGSFLSNNITILELEEVHPCSCIFLFVSFSFQRLYNNTSFNVRLLTSYNKTLFFNFD